MIELPPRAAAKLAKLQQQSADMRALVDAARGSEAMLREKLGHAQHASRVAVADMSKQEAAAAIDGITANLALAEQEVQTRQARMHLAQRVVGQIAAGRPDGTTDADRRVDQDPGGQRPRGVSAA